MDNPDLYSDTSSVSSARDFLLLETAEEVDMDLEIDTVSDSLASSPPYSPPSSYSPYSSDDDEPRPLAFLLTCLGGG